MSNFKLSHTEPKVTLQIFNQEMMSQVINLEDTYDKQYIVLKDEVHNWLVDNSIDMDLFFTDEDQTLNIVFYGYDCVSVSQDFFLIFFP